MNCTCSPLSAFRWRERLAASCWANDPEVKYGEKQGKTHSQIAAETKDRFQEATGRELNEELSGRRIVGRPTREASP